MYVQSHNLRKWEKTGGCSFTNQNELCHELSIFKVLFLVIRKNKLGYTQIRCISQ